MPVLGSGHPLADVFLLKYRPQPAEVQEGVAFYGRSGAAVLKSLRRLGVDPLLIYGTNCVKCSDGDPDAAHAACPVWLLRELAIVEPRIVVVMGEEAVDVLNDLEVPASTPRSTGRWSARCSRSRRRSRRLVTPDIDGSLNDDESKARVLARVPGARPMARRAAAVLDRRLLVAAARSPPRGWRGACWSRASSWRCSSSLRRSRPW